MAHLVAIGSVPKDGGTFTFYSNQRPALLERGIDLRCVTVGRREAGLREEAFVDAGCVLLAAEESNLKKQARFFVDWCEQKRIDIVIGINSEAILSAIPHLPERVRVISRCANAFDEGYRYAMIGAPRLAAMVALTPRLRNDLVSDYGADPSLIRLIPNGVDPGRFDQAAARERGAGRVLELGFLGRLEHKQKGVMHLPKIVAGLRDRGVAFRLRIAGKGIHRPDLERAMRAEIANGSVKLLGALGPDEVPGFLESTDVFLFPSHFEGCPNALLEAMMAGCVPVSWVIDGITDFLLEDRQTGFLVPMGDCGVFAFRVAGLAQDRAKLRVMSAAVAKTARERYSVERAADDYAEVFQDVLTKPAPAWTSKPWGMFDRDVAFVRSWTNVLPNPLRTSLRNILQTVRRPTWL